MFGSKQPREKCGSKYIQFERCDEAGEAGKLVECQPLGSGGLFRVERMGMREGTRRVHKMEM